MLGKKRETSGGRPGGRIGRGKKHVETVSNRERSVLGKNLGHTNQIELKKGRGAQKSGKKGPKAFLEQERKSPDYRRGGT